MNNYEEQLLQEQQELHQVHHAEEEPQLLQPPTLGCPGKTQNWILK